MERIYPIVPIFAIEESDNEKVRVFVKKISMSVFTLAYIIIIIIIIIITIKALIKMTVTLSQL